jgi:hypothetical protein
MFDFVIALKPLDILGPVFLVIATVALIAVAGSVVLGFLALLLQPFYALLTHTKVEEDACWLWAGIVVVGLIVWQLA